MPISPSPPSGTKTSSSWEEAIRLPGCLRDSVSFGCAQGGKEKIAGIDQFRPHRCPELQAAGRIEAHEGSPALARGHPNVDCLTDARRARQPIVPNRLEGIGCAARARVAP